MRCSWASDSSKAAHGDCGSSSTCSIAGLTAESDARVASLVLAKTSSRRRRHLAIYAPFSVEYNGPTGQAGTTHWGCRKRVRSCYRVDRNDIGCLLGAVVVPDSQKVDA